MGERFMRIMVFFDLPVTSRKQRKDYTQFRKFLIESGYIMLQYSVYSRTVRNHDDAASYLRRLESKVPPAGAVRAMVVTEKQYASMHLLAGERLQQENLLDTKSILEL